MTRNRAIAAIAPAAVVLRQKAPRIAGIRNAEAIPVPEKTMMSWRYLGGCVAMPAAIRPMAIVAE